MKLFLGELLKSTSVKKTLKNLKTQEFGASTILKSEYQSQFQNVANKLVP